MSDKDRNKKWFKRFLVMGVVLLLGSWVFWLTPRIVLGSINSKIKSPALHGPLMEPEQKMLTDLQWSKIWWEKTEITVFFPISTILLIFGVVLIVCGLAVRFKPLSVSLVRAFTVPLLYARG